MKILVSSPLRALGRGASCGRRLRVNDTFGCITEIDLSKQRNLVNLLTDGSCIAVKFENVAVYEESKADNPLEEFTRFEEINQPVYGWPMLIRKRFLIFLKTIHTSLSI